MATYKKEVLDRALANTKAGKKLTAPQKAAYDAYCAERPEPTAAEAAVMAAESAGRVVPETAAPSSAKAVEKAPEREPKAIGYMHNCIVDAFQGGARSAISRSFAETYTTRFDEYLQDMEELYERAKAYAKLHREKAPKAEQDAAAERVWAFWKPLVRAASGEDRINCTERDLEDIYASVRLFMADKNSRDRDDPAKYIPANKQFRNFRREIELTLAHRLCDVKVMDDATRDWLDMERQLMGAVSGIQSSIDEVNEQIKPLRGIMASAKAAGESATVKFVEAQIASKEQKIKTLEGKLPAAESKLQRFREGGFALEWRDDKLVLVDLETLETEAEVPEVDTAAADPQAVIGAAAEKSAAEVLQEVQDSKK